MATIGNLNVKLSASSASFVSGLAKAQASLTSFGSFMSSTAGRISAFGSAALAAAAGGGLAVLVKQSMTAIATTGEMADRLGIASDALGRLQYAARSSGSSAEEMNASLRKMLLSIYDASVGGESANKSFVALGLSASRLRAVSPDEAFIKIADAISSIQDPAKRAAVTMDIFGKSGASLGNLIAGGAAGVRSLGDEADRLNQAFNATDTSKVRSALDAFARLRSVFTGMANVLAVQLAPTITALSDEFVAFSTTGNNSSRIVINGVELVARAVAKVADAFNLIKAAAIGFQGTVTAMASVAVASFGAIIYGVEALQAKIAGSRVDHSLSEVIGAAAQGMADEAVKQFGRATDAYQDFENGVNSAKVEAFFRSVRLRADEAAAAAVKSSQSVKAFGDITEVASGDGDKLVASLRQQIATFGMTSRQAEIFALQQAGASDAVLETARSLDAQLTTMERFNAMQQEAASIYEQTRTPLEKYENQIGKLGEMLDRGMIDWETYGRAVRSAREQLESVGKAVTGTELEGLNVAGLGGRSTGPAAIADTRTTASIRGIDYSKSPLTVKGQTDVIRELKNIARNTESNMVLS